MVGDEVRRVRGGDDERTLGGCCYLYFVSPYFHFFSSCYPLWALCFILSFVLGAFLLAHVVVVLLCILGGEYSGSIAQLETAIMLSLARSFAHPTFSRSLVQRAAAIHTLPELPYAYNVS